MEDKHPEVVTVALGGKSRRLKLGPAAFRLAKKRHDVRITVAELSSPSFDTLAQLVWIGLLPDEPDLDEDTVLGWMADSDDEGELLRAAMQSLSHVTDGLSAGPKRPFVKGKK